MHHQVGLTWLRDATSMQSADVGVVAWVDVFAEPGAPSPSDVFGDATVVAVDLREAAAVAAWIESRQRALRRRLSIRVVAVGTTSTPAGSGYAAEDHLGAGAVIAGLVDRGIDAISPEAAVADAAFRGLEVAVGPLAAAAVRAREFDTHPSRYRVDRTLDGSAVRVLRPGRV